MLLPGFPGHQRLSRATDEGGKKQETGRMQAH